jgi:A/G-specific adenine glycosylase
MVRRPDGFPSSREELETLPAVGQYVASAVLLFAHKRPEPLLDANMARVLERAFEPRRLVDIRYDLRLQALARLLVRSRDPIRVNWAILDVAARHCGPRLPKCDGCPLRSRCNHALSAS